jgi:hypothetical protein
MAKIKELIQQKLPEYLLASLIGTIAALLAIAWKEISVPVVQKLLPELSKTGLLAIILILLLALILSFLYILISRRKHRHYFFDKHAGIHFHKLTKEPFCPSCLSTDIESPLKDEGHAWRCPRKDCAMYYPNPDHKTPPPKKVSHGLAM